VVLRCRAHGVEPHGKAAPRARDGHFETAFPKLQRVAGVSDDPWAVLAACMGTVQWYIAPIVRGARLRVAAATESSCEAATAKPAASGCHRVRGICQQRHRAAMSLCRHGMLIQPAVRVAGLGWVVWCRVVWCGVVWCGVEVACAQRRNWSRVPALCRGGRRRERAIHCIHDIDIDIDINLDFEPHHRAPSPLLAAGHLNICTRHRSHVQFWRYVSTTGCPSCSSGYVMSSLSRRHRVGAFVLPSTLACPIQSTPHLPLVPTGNDLSCVVCCFRRPQQHHTRFV
jgi:hypothetical protein